MTVLVPERLADALEALAVRPDAIVLAGGTDLMVEVNERRRLLEPGRSPDAPTVLAVSNVPELTTWTVDPESRTLTLGAGITWGAIEREPLRSMAPALAEAARTVGSPQIRNVGTIGGNLATCSPAGDGLPALSAVDATVTLASADGTRSLPIHDFMVGVKRTALVPGEVILSVTMPMLRGWQGFSKVGIRNAMVIATASACVAIDVPTRSVRLSLGSVGPTVIRCPEAEAMAAGTVDWEAMSLDDGDAREFGRLAASSSTPIDDHRSTADYRRHAVAVMATRLLHRAFPGDPASTGEPT